MRTAASTTIWCNFFSRSCSKPPKDSISRHENYKVEKHYLFFNLQFLSPSHRMQERERGAMTSTSTFPPFPRCFTASRHIRHPFKSTLSACVRVVEKEFRHGIQLIIRQWQLHLRENWKLHKSSINEKSLHSVNGTFCALVFLSSIHF